jgi:TonB family protein
MEALVRPASDYQGAPLLLLGEQPEPRQTIRWGAWTGSILLHALVIFGLARLPREMVASARMLAGIHIFTPLIEPPAELTQKAPNKGKIGKEFDLESLRSRPRLFVPPGLRAGAPTVRIPGPGAAPPSALPEPPKLEGSLARMQPPPLGTTPAVQGPPPAIQGEEKPKLAFEVPGAPSGTPAGAGKLASPSNSVQDAVRAAIRRGPSGGLIVGDLGEGSGGAGEGLNLPPSPGRTGSSLELLSDPQGVDFRPYLIRILAAVRRNWLAVIPESARLGRQGRVQIQFAISRDGRVPKLVIALPSGTDGLDRAAVAGISASNPFPPLPAEFRGDQVRLQFTFLYNLAPR